MNQCYYGAKPDKHDPRDFHFMAAHSAFMTSAILPRSDFRFRLPPSYDQGPLGSCGPNSFKRLMAFLYPNFDGARLQVYWDVRNLEGDTGDDTGVQTRDLFRIGQQIGMSPESDYPYNITNFREKPSLQAYRDALTHRISRYSRLTTAHEILACLSGGMVFISGFQVPQSFEDPEMARTGIMTMNQANAGRFVGGHDVCVVGHDMAFKNSATFKASGIDPALVTDHALLIANSWGTAWGIDGHFWAPLMWMVDFTTGADCWTGSK